MKAIGEVVSASIKSFTVEVWHEDTQTSSMPPGFGSLLRCVSSEFELEVFGVIYDVVTGPQDNYHKATAMKMSRKQLRQEQPQIFSLLKTDLHAAVCGYKKDGQFFARLAPQPPQVHDFVYSLSRQEIKDATSDLEFLRLISWVTSIPNDELIAAVIREAALARDNDYKFLVSAGKSLSQLFREDYDRLVSVLKKINPDAN